MKRFLPYILAFAIGFMAGIAWADNPRTAVASALADAKSLNPVEARTTRYISLYNVPNGERDAALKTLDFVANSIAGSANIRRARVVSLDSGIVALDLAAYGINPVAYEAATSDGEPYFHITARVIDPRTGKPTTVRTDGGWVGLPNAAKLRAITGSGAPVVRLDWFIHQATRKHYYTLAGIPKTRAEFYAGLGVDEKTIVAVEANHGANVFVSGVTKKARRLSRWQGPHGGVWQTYDAEKTDATNDPFRDPTFNAKFDASELIAAKANGLHVFALYDSKGNRQDSVPDTLAKDDSDPHGDGILVPMVSCVRCHREGDGLRSFSNDQQKLLGSGVDLLSDDPRVVDRLKAFYGSPKLPKGLERDREDYAAAVAEATGGWKVQEMSDALAKVVANYEAPVTRDTALLELGAKTTATLVSSRDPVILAIKANIPVTRGQWDAAVAEALLLAEREWLR